MANFSYDFAGGGAFVADSITVAGAANISGRVTGAGFSSSIAGSSGVPAYNWTSDPDNGPYYSGVANRCEWSSGGADNQSWRVGLILAYQTLQATPPANVPLNYLKLSVRNITATDTIAVGTDFTILADPTTGNIVVNLPTATSASGRVFVVRKIVASANTVTITPNGAETIDGAATAVVGNTAALMFQSNGTTWYSIGYEPIVAA